MSAGVLLADPSALRSAAVSMRGMAHALEESARAVHDADDGSWHGLAALEAAARRTETATLLRTLAVPVTTAADGLDLVASVAEDTGQRVRGHLWELEDLHHERTRLLVLGPPADLLASAQWHARLGALEEATARLETLVGRAQEEFADAQRAVAALLERELGPELYAILGTLAFVHQTGRYLARGGAGLRAAGSAASAVHRLRRMRVPGGERTLHVVSTRLREAAGRLGGQLPGWLSKVPGVAAPAAAVAARGVPLLMLPDAAGKVVTGGGYAGVRAGVTRVLAGAAVVGVTAAVVVTAPVTGAAAATAGIVTAGAYTAWMTGNYVWDDRRRLGRLAGRAWATTRDGAARGRSSAGAVVDRARDRARSGLRRLRDSPLPPDVPSPAGAGS